MSPPTAPNESVWSRRSVRIFFLIGFGVPWLGWTINAFTEVGQPLRTVLFYTGDFMTIGGLVAISVAGGGAALRAMLGRSLRGGSIGWWLFALFLPLVWQVASRLAYGATHGGIGPFEPAGLAAFVAPGALLALTTGPLGEEAGWRGFFLPRLLTRYSPLVASLILGLIWAVWHVPLYVKSVFAHGSSTISFTLGVLCSAILMTILFHRTRGSLLLAVLFHWAFNVSPGVADALLPDADAVALGSRRVYETVALLATTVVVASMVGWKGLGRVPEFGVERDLAAEAVNGDRER